MLPEPAHGSLIAAATRVMREVGDSLRPHVLWRTGARGKTQRRRRARLNRREAAARLPA
jgi:hypothetical protein